MSYEPPRHILLRRQTKLITNVDLAYLERALQRQLNDVAYFYGLPAPGVTVVDPVAEIPISEAVGIDFVDDDGVAGAVAHHGWLPGANFPWSLVGVGETRSWSQAGSHEAIEMLLNLRLDRFVTAPDGTIWPMEGADMVEARGYPIGNHIWGKFRDTVVSNYVLPSFWRADGLPPYDYMGELQAPFSVAEGGYALVVRDGALVELGAARQRTRPASRVTRIRAARSSPQ